MRNCIYLAYDKDDAYILKQQAKDKWNISIVFDNTKIIPILEKEEKDFILFDLEAGGKFPIEILSSLSKDFPLVPIFILTHSENNNIRKDFSKYNVLDFFEVSNSFDEIIEKVESLLSEKYTQCEKEEALFVKEKSPAYLKDEYPMIIGKSPAILELKNFVRKAANQDFPVLLSGETGTGKSMVAKVIHENSEFSSGNFVPVNLSCIPESLAEALLFGSEAGSFTDAKTKDGLFLSANNGTLFLDELEDLPLSIQSKLLTVLETKELRPVGSLKTKKINFRLICATNKNLKKLVEEAKFRKDLYYRLDVLHHTLASLRERKNDLPLLIDFYLKNKNKSISKEAVYKLLSHDWPGNVRELFNCLDRAYSNAIDDDIISSSHIDF